MKQTKRRTALYALGLFGGLISVAVWGKMRFVTDLPRMAYAVPEDETEQASDNDTESQDLSPVSKPENEAPETGGE